MLPSNMFWFNCLLFCAVPLGALPRLFYPALESELFSLTTCLETRLFPPQILTMTSAHCMWGHMLQFIRRKAGRSLYLMIAQIQIMNLNEYLELQLTQASSSAVLASTSCQSHPALLQMLQSSQSACNLAGSYSCRSEMHEDAPHHRSFWDRQYLNLYLSLPVGAHLG